MDYVIAGIVSLGLFIYLVYALLRPERWSQERTLLKPDDAAYRLQLCFVAPA